MNWRNPALAILGLSKKEADILNHLSVPLSLQELSGVAAYSRTTIAYCLKGLLKRSFVEKSRHGKRYKFQALPSEQLNARFIHATVHMNASDPDTFKSNVSEGQKVFQYTGLKTVSDAQKQFLSAHKNERILAQQSNKAWIALHEKVGPEGVIELNQIIRDNNLILDAMIERDTYDMFNSLHGKKSYFPKLAKSFAGRMADYAFSPKGFLTGPVEIWIAKNTILLINWNAETAVKIIDHDITALMKDMFLLSKEDRAKVDHNQAIRKLLK